ncbi:MULTISPECIES: DNA polymerase Y family protein [unclassified Nitrobacter]|uniref:Y-family DNA polymerase n=1 Tax=unclassified Nitrobacter TaxID=2620411 RepID=UPI0025FA32AD|nr:MULTISPECIES: DNA polymerase Y family protein [unclassified Nitrobacter]
MVRRRILSLWLPRLPTDRIVRELLRYGGLVEACRASQSSPTMMEKRFPRIVVAKQNNALVISALDDAAARIGLAVGLPLANARAICPEIDVFDADEIADGKTLSGIADWCDRFTPLVALDPPHGLLLDITGCAHLFGGEAALMNALCGALTRQGFVVSAAIAGTPACARALTRHAHGRIVAPGEEARAIAALPVFTLGADDAITRGLRRVGLKTIGDVAARGRHEIAARFGSAFTTLLEQALGQSDAPINPRKPLPDFIVEKRFAEPIATDGAIAMTLASLARTLIAAMEKQGKGARRLEAVFFRTDGAVRVIAVETGRPVTRGETIDRLFRERLDALADPLDPGFGFDLVRLSAVRTDLVIQEQRDLDTHVRDNDEVAALVDRLAARIGSHRVVVHLPQDTHIPERASVPMPAQQHLAAAMRAEWLERIEGEPPLRPLRLFAPPEPIEVTAMFPDGPPAQFKWRHRQCLIAHVEGPERIAMEWWNRCEQPLSPEPDDEFMRLHPPQGEVAVARADGSALTRDYFRAEDREGVRYWLYREGTYEREVQTFRWFLHGLFA